MKIKPGKNIALKIPPNEFAATVKFYRDVLQLQSLGTAADGSIGFDFDGKELWLDQVSTLSQAEMWLEVRTNDLESAEKHFSDHDIVRCDEIEPLPEGFRGFWIKNSASIVHLVSEHITNKGDPRR